jgi:adenylate cyclase
MQPQHRHLAAILFTDIVGYTSMMQQNEIQAVAAIKRHNSVLERLATAHHGQVANYYGDGSLSIFQSATEAIQAAVEMQIEMRSDPAVPLRIGLHIGEIFFEEGKALGDGVNLASRIQSLGQANTILFSGELHDKIKNRPEFTSVSLGLFEFKNVDKPIEVYALSNEGLQVPKKEQMEGKLKKVTKGKLSTTKKLLTGAALVLLLVASIFLYKQFAGKNKFTGKDKSIAVLPFVNMSGNKDNEYLSDGITDEITIQLAKISDLKVISRTTAMHYKDSKLTAKEIARELGVSSLLEGSVQRSGDATRITAELIDGNTEGHLWANQYDHKNMNDMFAMQSEVAQHIAEQLNARFSVDEKKKIEKKPTNNPEAYNLYLRGRYFWNQRIEPSLRKGITYFDSAIALDPLYARAYSGKADCFMALGYGSFDLPGNTFPKAQAAAMKAIELDSSLADPHASLGYFKLYYAWDFPGAELEFKKALLLNPKYEIAYDWYGVFLTAMGRLEEAHKIIEKAQQLDPLSAFISTDMGFNLYYDKKFDAAIQALNSTLELNPRFILARLWLGRVYQIRKMYPEAIAQYQLALNVAPQWPVAWSQIGSVYGVSGNEAGARRILDTLSSLSSRKFVTSYGVALVHMGLGEKEQTFVWLNKAYDERSHWLVWLNLDPRWDPIRSDKRFTELVSKVGLPH